MKTVICTIAFAAFAVVPRADADVPPGPDAINGAFVRMLGNEATTPVAVATTPASDRLFERWVNRVARNEMSSVDAGFARMIARTAETPAPLTARGEPEPLARMIAAALQAQRARTQAFASRN
jgi:hypothetical protein